jgi:hypothetical protein
MDSSKVDGLNAEGTRKRIRVDTFVKSLNKEITDNE